MTLAEKADHYLKICRARHVRAPGFVEKCYFPNPEDTSVFLPRDDDNDGQYTSMYLAMESFRYAVTRDPQARAHANEAFDASNTCEPSPRPPALWREPSSRPHGLKWPIPMKISLGSKPWRNGSVIPGTRL